MQELETSFLLGALLICHSVGATTRCHLVQPYSACVNTLPHGHARVYCGQRARPVEFCDYCGKSKHRAYKYMCALRNPLYPSP